MGLLDSVAGAVLGKVLGGGQGGVAQIAMDLLNNSGGLGGMVDKFKQGGLAEQAASWVGKGENLPVSADQITSVLGNDTITAMAAKFGISTEELSGKIAQYLPEMVDKATPDGAVTEKSGDLLSSVLGMFK